MLSRTREIKNSSYYSCNPKKIISTLPKITSSISKTYSVDECNTDEILFCLENFIEDIVTFYRITWQRDCELGYPGYHDALEKSESSFEERLNLRQEEITRLNTILPKLEESYITKLRDCWSSLVFKLRQMSERNPQNFKRLVTNIQVRILTYKNAH
ncbi:hypothetical protein PV327_010232 [Microctonus hyperodae]|uniref:Uncharacterized protein n=1 Tax=Microctonus hyperodae TaxID=165561 RepID=A0AA39FRG6_MICHY|nr:hypothetical protein PV327_010232 [Microctonus hyperodae]